MSYIHIFKIYIYNLVVSCNLLSYNACILFLQKAFDACEDPDMMAQVLEVLRLDDIGKAKHADKIQEFYYEEIERHKLCEKCHH